MTDPDRPGSGTPPYDHRRRFRCRGAFLIALHFAWHADRDLCRVWARLHLCTATSRSTSPTSRTPRAAPPRHYIHALLPGQADRPGLYGFGFAHGGPEPTLLSGAVVVMGVGLVCACGPCGTGRFKRHRKLRKNMNNCVGRGDKLLLRRHAAAKIWQSAECCFDCSRLSAADFPLRERAARDDRSCDDAWGVGRGPRPRPRLDELGPGVDDARSSSAIASVRPSRSSGSRPTTSRGRSASGASRSVSSRYRRWSASAHTPRLDKRHAN